MIPTVARANPVTYLKRSHPPFALFHGSVDHLVSPSQTLLLHTALRAKGVDSTRYIIVGAGHGILAPPNAARPWTTRKVMNLVASFLNQHLG